MHVAKGVTTRVKIHRPKKNDGKRNNAANEAEDMESSECDEQTSVPVIQSVD
jgi:hypothetical protein